MVSFDLLQSIISLFLLKWYSRYLLSYSGPTISRSSWLLIVDLYSMVALAVGLLKFWYKI